MCNWHDGNKNNLWTTEAQIVQKPKNEARPKFTGSYNKKKKRVAVVYQSGPVNNKK